MALGIFCGSSAGLDPRHAELVRTLAHEAVADGHDIIYGGGGTGLMAVLARAVMEAGGRMIGIMPRTLLDRGAAFRGLSELVVVETMHERKALMSQRADAFVALPGGPGTLEEIVEQWVWGQLGLHAKPCGILDDGGFYAPLQDLIGSMVAAGFMQQQYADVLMFEPSPRRLLDRFAQYQPPPPKWSVPPLA